MKIMFLDWSAFGKYDMKEAMLQAGHEVVDFFHEDYNLRCSTEFMHYMDRIINTEKPQLVFSFNYYPLVSYACENHSIPYAAWVYDCPQLFLYSASVINKCNYIFIFDKETYHELHSSGINTVYYLPLAANTTRLDSLVPDESIHSKADCDISFIGSMYNEEHNFYERLTGIDQYTKGYLDGVIESQLLISGYNFTEKVLTDNILKELKRVYPYTHSSDGVESDAYIYTRYFLDRKISQLERHRVITALSKEFHTCLYTQNLTPDIPKVHNMGTIDHITMMPYVVKCSKINLNITLKSIHTGIPLRAIETMGAGGFLVSNYQADFLDYFEPGTDYVYYEDINNLIELCRYYLSHDSERRQIALNGHNKVQEFHTYSIRLSNILNTIFTAAA